MSRFNISARLLTTLLACFALIAVFSLPAAGNAMTPATAQVVQPEEVERGRRIEVSGVITNIERDSFTLRTDRGTDIKVFVYDRTEITINGRQARYSQLEVRDSARVKGTATRTIRGVQMRAFEVAVRR